MDNFSSIFFGSCRVKVHSSPPNFYFTRKIAGTHTPLETLQLLKYINEPNFKSKYLFSRVELNKINRKRYKHYYNKSKIVVVEICSRKVYEAKNGDISLYEGAKLFRYEKGNDKWIIKNLTDDEIEKSIIKIKNYIAPKKLILVTHFKHDKVSSSRNYLIDFIIKIAEKYDILYFNPTFIAKGNKNIVDPSHYSEEGAKLYSKNIIEIIKSIK